jgi:RimJ/RimL family protein N-acetyltransferase
MTPSAVPAPTLKSTIVRSWIDSEAPALAGDATTSARELVLADGARLRVRAVRPDDEPRLRMLFERLSQRSVYQRFLTPFPKLPAEWFRHFAAADDRARLALVVEDGPADRPVLRALAQLEPGAETGTGEVAVVVEDAWQGRGIGARLLDSLLVAAEALGVRRFTADLLAENRRMLRVIWRLGEIRHRELDHGVLTLEFERRRASEQRTA